MPAEVPCVILLAFGWRRERLLTVDAQYFMRTEGDFDCKFGNELSVSGGPGFYLLFDEDRTLALEAVIGHETKGRDSIDGDKRDEGIASAWYAGPGITMTWGERFSATLNGSPSTNCQSLLSNCA